MRAVVAGSDRRQDGPDADTRSTASSKSDPTPWPCASGRAPTSSKLDLSDQAVAFGRIGRFLGLWFGGRLLRDRVSYALLLVLLRD